ncbi:MAG: Crp/Fnr family transcriptional regulator [Candidatus Dormibacteria bacterium]
MDTVRALLGAYPFRDLSVLEIEGLAVRAVPRFLDAGEHLYRAGDAATALHVVAQGLLKEYALSHDGGELIFEFFGAGATFGEPGLFVPEQNRVASVAALQPSLVICLPRQVLITFLFEHPPAMMRILEGLSLDVRKLADDQVGLAYDPVQARLVVKLLELAEAQADEASPGGLSIARLSQAELAAAVGASRAKVNRTLGALASVGAVSLGPGRRITLYPPALRRLGRSDALPRMRNRPPPPA